MKSLAVCDAHVKFAVVFLTLKEDTRLSRGPVCDFHSAFVIFFPSLNLGGQRLKFESTKCENGGERGRKGFIGHVLRQVGLERIEVPVLERPLEYVDKLILSGHVWGLDGRSRF
jgi:hypothetical protein